MVATHRALQYSSLDDSDSDAEKDAELTRQLIEKEERQKERRRRKPQGRERVCGPCNYFIDTIVAIVVVGLLLYLLQETFSASFGSSALSWSFGLNGWREPPKVSPWEAKQFEKLV